MQTEHFQGIGTLAINLADSFIGIKKVCEISGLSKSTVLRWAKAGKFPDAIIEAGNMKRWSLAECKAWQQDRVRERAERQAGLPASVSSQAP